MIFIHTTTSKTIIATIHSRRIHSRRIHSCHYRHWNHRNLTNINISCSPKDAEEEDVASSSPPPFLSLSLLPPPSSISLMPCRRQYRCALKICLHHHHPHYCFGFWRREIIKVIGQKKKRKKNRYTFVSLKEVPVIVNVTVSVIFGCMLLTRFVKINEPMLLLLFTVIEGLLE